jgi:hypothetical protein
VPGGTGELAQVHALQLPAELGPGVAGGGLGDPNQDQCEEAQGDVGADALLFAVVDRAQVEDVLEVSPGPLDLDELLVQHGQVGGGDGVVGARQQPLAVQLGLGAGLGLVDGEPPLAAGEVAGQGGVGEQLAFGAQPGVALLAVDGGKLVLEALEGSLPAGLVSPGLGQVAAEDEPSPADAVADPDLLDLEVVGDEDVPLAVGFR